MQGYITKPAGEDPQPEVHISVDKFAKYAKVAETLADLQSRGLKKIGLRCKVKRGKRLQSDVGIGYLRSLYIRGPLRDASAI